MFFLFKRFLIKISYKVKDFITNRKFNLKLKSISFVEDKLFLSAGYTLLESIVALILFTFGILIVSQMYLSLMRSALLAQNLQLALDNARFGAEKVWSEIKNGSNFVISTTPTSTILEFKDRRCQLIKVYQDNDNLIYEINGSPSTRFDNRLVSLRNFQIYYDKPTTTGTYYQTANKIFVLHYQLDLKTKTLIIPFEFWQTVAPANSVFINNPCQ